MFPIMNKRSGIMALALVFPNQKPIDLKNLHVYDALLKTYFIAVLPLQLGLSGR